MTIKSLSGKIDMVQPGSIYADSIPNSVYSRKPARKNRSAIGYDGDYDCRFYEMDKLCILGMNLTSTEYEKAIKELCDKNNF